MKFIRCKTHWWLFFGTSSFVWNKAERVIYWNKSSGASGRKLVTVFRY